MFACNGILFNHESPRRGETFVTRKITRGLANIAMGLEDCLFMGNINAMRDWGHTKDYVKMQWLMLQQESPKDYVISSGKQFSVREFIIMSAHALGIELEFSGKGIDEIASVVSVDNSIAPFVKSGQVILRVDKKYFRPNEVETLLGDSSLAMKELGWAPQITVKDMCKEMIDEDLKTATIQAKIHNDK